MLLFLEFLIRFLPLSDICHTFMAWRPVLPATCHKWMAREQTVTASIDMVTEERWLLSLAAMIVRQRISLYCHVPVKSVEQSGVCAVLDSLSPLIAGGVG